MIIIGIRRMMQKRHTNAQYVLALVKLIVGSTIEHRHNIRLRVELKRVNLVVEAV